MKYFQLFFFIYVIVVGLIYALTRRGGLPWLLPGDLFIKKANREFYIPLGSSLIITVLVFAILFNFIP